MFLCPVWSKYFRNFFDLFTHQSFPTWKGFPQVGANSLCTCLYQSTVLISQENSSAVYSSQTGMFGFYEKLTQVFWAKQHSRIFPLVAFFWSSHFLHLAQTPNLVDPFHLNGQTALNQLRTFHLASFQCAWENCILRRIDRAQKMELVFFEAATDPLKPG